MYILGILNDTDGGAALLKDGKPLMAVGEERFSRVKMDDRFPADSINAVLDFAGITLSDVDVVSYSWHSGFPYEKHLHDFVARAIAIAESGKEAKRIALDRIKAEVERDVPQKKEFDEWVKKECLTEKIQYFDHHRSHAAAAYYTSPFDKALVITLDARGNFRSATVHIAKDGQMKEVACNYSFDSLGMFYAQITTLLGFKAHRHEGKVTGLAAYGDSKKCLSIMQQMITVKEGKIYGLIGKYYIPFLSRYTPALKKALKGYSREDIAAAAQTHLEDMVIRFISYYLKKYKIGNIAVAGGVFANVKVNQKVRAIPGVKDLYVFPHMGDGGLPMGAAQRSWHGSNKNRKRYPLLNVYLGPSSSEKDLQAAVKKYSSKVKLSKYTRRTLIQKVIELLQNDTVVGLFQGRMEFGPRALGNRSILYHANDPSANEWLNKRLRRTEFMPFAPITTKKLAPQCFRGWKPYHTTTNFMTECYDCTAKMKKNSPAVVHVDGTARPQIIERSDNPFYYDIVERWNKKTGGLCLINTSFNQHEEPIVCSIEDAIQSMLNDNVDCIVVNGKYLLERKQLLIR